MPAIHRRTLLKAGFAAAAAGTLAACDSNDKPVSTRFVQPDGPVVADTEARRKPGVVRDFRLTAGAGPLDLGGVTVQTWSYDGVAPGKEMRVKAGEVVRATLVNRLPEPTTVHWHGLALRNNADGVPDVTQKPIAAGGQHVYEFTAAHPGTFWFHPHQGTQLDRGLYAPLIVEDPDEPLDYDDEWVVVLDDWLDGLAGRTPDTVLAGLRKGMSDMEMMTSYLLGGDAGDIEYPYFLVNGRVAAAPASYQGKPGTRLRIRIINAGGDTAFRVALGGHQMTVTHSDGFPLEPAATDALLVGMGERYDVLVTLGDGVFPLVALAEGKNDAGLTLVRTAAGAAPQASVRPKELNGRLVAYRNLKPAEAVALPAKTPDRTIKLELTGSMMRYDWAFNGRPYDRARIESIRAGERVQVDFINTTTMWHPIHLHGHTFAAGNTGLRKDTAIVLPAQTLSTVFNADNPGLWMIHCHNIYHAEAGMMTLFGYQR